MLIIYLFGSLGSCTNPTHKVLSNNSPLLSLHYTKTFFLKTPQAGCENDMCVKCRFCRFWRFETDKPTIPTCCVINNRVLISNKKGWQKYFLRTFHGLVLICSQEVRRISVTNYEGWVISDEFMPCHLRVYKPPLLCDHYTISMW